MNLPQVHVVSNLPRVLDLPRERIQASRSRPSFGPAAASAWGIRRLTYLLHSPGPRRENTPMVRLGSASGFFPTTGRQPSQFCSIKFRCVYFKGFGDYIILPTVLLSFGQ